MKKHSVIISGILISLFFFFPLYSQEDNTPTHIKIESSVGDIVLMLYDDTPLHRDNMIKLAEEGFYNNQIFHRVISEFMIQGGDPHSVGAARGQRLGTGGPGYTIPPEFNTSHFHKKGALAAARRGDNVNPEKHSSGSQFYIVQGKVFSSDELKIMEQRGVHKPFTAEETEVYTTIGGTPHLDGAYTVFGEVVKGLDAVDRICSLPTDAYDRPFEDIVFKISVIK
ncbi:MAG TPA: peptidylprolyl isomerase [Bacteroidaceae bacterium]|mgnify:CR=1 FL=1|nr:peptidylprolyl isomerase [Bacteroidaceae bacterium]